MKYTGLNDSEVRESKEKYGPNVIPDSKPTTLWKELKETFKDPMIKILIVISIIMLVMFFLGYADIYEPLGTIVAICIVAFVSAKTGVASDTKYHELKDNTEKDKCKVYRNGEISVIYMDDVVVGDMVLLQSGDKIPADGVLIDGSLKVDNSALNGEAEECKKESGSIDDTLPTEITGDTFVDKSSLFRGAVVLDGEGVFVVHRVGLGTMMGKMAEEMQEDEPDSPLKVKLADLAGKISKFGYIGATVIAIVYMAYFVMNAGGISEYLSMDVQYIIKDIVKAVSKAVVIIVCAVPEGLPLMISLVLMQNTSKMLDHNVLVRKAVGIETAGSLNILFSDKTGTITKGVLSVVEFFLGTGDTLDISGNNSYCKVKELLDISVCKNTQSMYDSTHNVVGGNATDRALVGFMGEQVFSSVCGREDLASVKAQGFNSANKFSQVEIEALGKTFYKGAPERLLAHAKRCLLPDGSVDSIDIDVLNEKIDVLAGKAMRVIAFGYSEKPMVENEINDDIVIIGLVGIRDDVRPEARNAIREVQEAGIQVVMITGDRLETAVAISEDAGLYKKGVDIAFTSSELASMSDDEIKGCISKIKVIARALPTDKSRMVRLCQEMNLVVGMTGDGVNDTPALKRADVGFAMGSGTEAAKEAGKIVILDDNFQSIKDAILYGRTIYHNILKFCKFQLAINVSAVAVSALSMFFGIEEPLKVTHLLFVNLVMDSLGAIMLGNEPAREEYMHESPRRRDESIISRSMMAQIGVVSVWMTAISFVFLKTPEFLHTFGSMDRLLTGYFVMFIACALFNGFNVRDDGYGIFRGLGENKNFIRVFVAVLAIQAAIIYSGLIPGLGWIASMFSCVPVSINCYLICIVFAITLVPIDLIRKAVTGVK